VGLFNRSVLCLTLSLGGGAVASSGALAQESSSSNPESTGAERAGLRPTGASAERSRYRGVSPEAGVTPPKASRSKRAKRPLITWPGFQARRDGASRVFIQTSEPVQPETRSGEGTFVLRFANTGVHLRTNRLPIETRYFDTPVTRIRVVRFRRDVEVVLELRAAVTPEVRTLQDANGFHYVVAEFPSGKFLQEEDRARPAAPKAPTHLPDADSSPSAGPPPENGIRVRGEATSTSGSGSAGGRGQAEVGF